MLRDGVFRATLAHSPGVHVYVYGLQVYLEGPKMI